MNKGIIDLIGSDAEFTIASVTNVITEKELNEKLKIIFQDNSGKIFLSSMCADCWHLPSNSSLRKQIKSLTGTCSVCGKDTIILGNLKNETKGELK